MQTNTKEARKRSRSVDVPSYNCHAATKPPHVNPVSKFRKLKNSSQHGQPLESGGAAQTSLYKRSKSFPSATHCQHYKDMALFEHIFAEATPTPYENERDSYDNTATNFAKLSLCSTVQRLESSFLCQEEVPRAPIDQAVNTHDNTQCGRFRQEKKSRAEPTNFFAEQAPESSKASFTVLLDFRSNLPKQVSDDERTSHGSNRNRYLWEEADKKTTHYSFGPTKNNTVHASDPAVKFMHSTVAQNHQPSSSSPVPPTLSCLKQESQNWPQLDQSASNDLATFPVCPTDIESIFNGSAQHNTFPVGDTNTADIFESKIPLECLLPEFWYSYCKHLQA